VRQLAKRHVGYGAKHEHYAAVGQALIETLAAGLGTGFTPDVLAAWQAAYALLATVMMEAAGGEATAG
jgi:hemoglobin-like flavoprotein